MSQPETRRVRFASHREPRRIRLTRWAVAASWLAFLGGCDDPCEKLQQKVCDDIAYYKANKKHCDLMTEQARREALPKDFCESILKSIAKR